jgi:hypothetical protein
MSTTPESTLGTWATGLEVTAKDLAAVVTSTSVPESPPETHTAMTPGPWPGFVAVALFAAILLARARHGHVARAVHQ